jgi:murein DD-endopeptidase MepM/ murein hydrolase activator NlpD
MALIQLVAPVARLTSVGTLHPTAGLPNYPAHDWFAAAGGLVLSPAAGRVTKLSGHPPMQGPVSGPHGPFAWSVYIEGDGASWYLTHLGSRIVALGDLVRRGQPIGTVADFLRYGTPSHVHMGVHSPGAV